jgi:hypothetical protein
MRKFLSSSGYQVRISRPHNWDCDAICDVMMVALRSEIDVLSGSYPSIDAFLAHVRAQDIVDVPVPSRGIVLSNEDWDILLRNYQELGFPFPFKNETLRKSRHLYQFSMFMEKFGLKSHEGYLETRGWYCQNPELQRMTLEVVLQGNGHKIFVGSGDYRDHIISLLRPKF